MTRLSAVDDSATLWIAIGSLSVSLAGVAWQVWNGRRIHRATVPIVDVSYTLWKSERNAHPPGFLYPSPRFVIRNTGRGTARHIRFEGLSAKFPQLSLKALIEPEDPSFHAESWMSVSYTHEVDALDPGESAELEVNGRNAETEFLIVARFRDALDQEHFTMTRFTYDGANEDWTHFGAPRTFTSRRQLERGLARLVGRNAARAFMTYTE